MRKDTSILLATLDYQYQWPIGVHSWTFEKSLKCIDDSDKSGTRRLSLYPASVKEPGQYCCHDGRCIDSEFVCDSVPHCEDESDEMGCTMVLIPKTYDKINPKKNVLVKITIMDLLAVDDSESSFEIFFFQEVTWLDHELDFSFLKKQSIRNIVDESLKMNIWIPEVKYMHVLSGNVMEEKVYVNKTKGSSNIPSIDSLNQIEMNEFYEGKENYLIIESRRRMKFFCSFDQISLFPFGTEDCQMQLYLSGSAMQLTNLTVELDTHALDKRSIGQFLIHEWKVEKRISTVVDPNAPEEEVIVSLILSRDLKVTVMVTHLPTLLMNMINQLTNYISGEGRYDLIITVNITCMMVLASVYLSVSTSLPNTPSIKPVEVWLLISFIYPFMVIFVNIVMQVQFDHINHRFCLHHPQALELKIGELEKDEKKQNNGNIKMYSRTGKTWLHRFNKLTKLMAFVVNPTLYVCFIVFYFTATWDELKI